MRDSVKGNGSTFSQCIFVASIIFIFRYQYQVVFRYQYQVGIFPRGVCLGKPTDLITTAFDSKKYKYISI